MRALATIDRWAAPTAAGGVCSPQGVCGTHGPAGRAFRLASVTKLLTAYAVLVGVEESTVGLDEPAGPPGATVRHLLAHAAGLPLDGSEPIARPGSRRTYSNTGYEMLADHVARAAEMPFGTYAREAVLEPLGMGATSLDGSPAHGATSTVGDLLRFCTELLGPTLVHPATLAEATAVQYPDLDGVLPGFGKQSPNDWGLGFELRDTKSPHWTGDHNSPGTFGHFGAAGTFLWVDPAARVACVVLTDRRFDDWALVAWPALSDAVLTEVADR